jgi:hypothetical protein
MTVPAYFIADLLSVEEFTDIFGEGEEARIYAAGALGQGTIPEHPEKPYVVWNELPSTPFEQVDETSDAQQTFYTFYVYDHLGQIAKINEALRIIRARVKAMATFHADDGTFCMDSRWMGFSNTFTDREYDASVRFGTARFDVSQ